MAWSPRWARWAVAGTLQRSGAPRMRVADRLSHDTAASLQEYYLNTVSFWDRRSGLVRSDGAVTDREPALAALMGEGADALRWMMFRDSQTYMNDDILTKVDRASMHYSLETRAPFLDHELAAFAWRVPTAVHFRDGRGKWILRQALGRFVPAALIDRPKMGFAIPLGQWLRGALRDWAEHLLDPARIRDQGWLNPAPIRARWEYHLRGDDRYALALWSVLMFQSWLESETAASHA